MMTVSMSAAMSGILVMTVSMSCAESGVHATNP